METSIVDYLKQDKLFSIWPKTIRALFLTVGLGISSFSFATGLQENFDPVSTTLPTALHYVAPSNRTVNYAVFGPQYGWPVLFLDGNPSNYTSVTLAAPYQTLLETFNIRLIQPERIGYGITPFQCNAPYTNCITSEQYADDWAALMKSLGYTNYSVLAMSQGGQYADFFMKKYWQRVRSLHLSSSVDTSATRDYCSFMPDPLFFKAAIEEIYRDPSILWVLLQPRDLETVSSITGMIDWFNLTTATNTDGSGSSYDSWLECHAPVGNLNQVKTPVFIYHGLIDSTVPISMAENHAQAYKNVVRFRTYPNDAHLSSLRHFGQTVLDISSPYIPLRLVCLNLGNNINTATKKTLIVPDNLADFFVNHGQATEDICAWVGTPGE